MSQEMEFKNIVAQYSKVKPEEMTGEMRFREDLGFTSLDFMSFLGELEDTFDIESCKWGNKKTSKDKTVGQFSSSE